MYLIDTRRKKNREKEAADRLEAGVMTENAVIHKIEAATATPNSIPIMEDPPAVQNIPVAEYLNPEYLNKSEVVEVVNTNAAQGG